MDVLPREGESCVQKGRLVRLPLRVVQHGPVHAHPREVLRPGAHHSQGYDNGALWFDFNDAKPPRDLRFGAYTARPDGKKAVPESDPKAPLIRHPGVAWKAGECHHVVLTFHNLDTGKPDAVATLYDLCPEDLDR